jgi:hypothetical protein
MHIEPGLVDGTKVFLSYATAVASVGFGGKLALDAVKRDGVWSVLLRATIATVLVFGFFEVLPTHPVGVSEVHFILGSTLLLVLGAGPASLGLAGGLLIQGLFFAPDDLPQYAMNVTTLLVPLFATAVLARKVIPGNVAYVDIRYAQALKLSLAYQGGIVFWVGFWALYGQGLGADNLSSIGTFGVAYMTVVLLEPLIDLGVLALAKAMHRLKGSGLVEHRLHHAA